MDGILHGYKELRRHRFAAWRSGEDGLGQGLDGLVVLVRIQGLQRNRIHLLDGVRALWSKEKEGSKRSESTRCRQGCFLAWSEPGPRIEGPERGLPLIRTGAACGVAGARVAM